MKKKVPMLIRKLYKIDSFQAMVAIMILGLTKPKIKVKMHTFLANVNGECVGCAATNALLHLCNKEQFTNLVNASRRVTSYEETLMIATAIESSFTIVDRFEVAIDSLRATRYESALMYLQCMHNSIANIYGLPLKLIANSQTEVDKFAEQELWLGAASPSIIKKWQNIYNSLYNNQTDEKEKTK